MKHTLLSALLMLLIPLSLVSQQNDAKGCDDHPLLTRMPGYWIHGCDRKDFNAFGFTIAPGKKQEVEGRYYKVTYYPQNARPSKPSELEILRNFENAITGKGGKLIRKDKSSATFTLVHQGKEIWIEVWAEFTGKYGYTLVEKEEMKQQIGVNADALLSDLDAMGHSAVHGIYFDTGKSDLKEESNQAIEEVAKLLKKDAGLKLYVVGHTDNVGSAESNLLLSGRRTDAVIQALVGSHGIDPARLKSFGNGPYAPVASNATEEGRSRNRRVEIVRQ